MFNYPQSTTSHFLYGKYLAIINKYSSGCIEIEVDEMNYKNSFYFYSIKDALKRTRKDIRSIIKESEAKQC